MIGSYIGDLPTASALSDADILPVEQGASPVVTRKGTIGQIRTGLAALNHTHPLNDLVSLPSGSVVGRTSAGIGTASALETPMLGLVTAADTAGVWSTLSTVPYANFPSGTIIHTMTSYYTAINNFSSVIPVDGTTPQDTEGALGYSATIAPKLSASKIIIDISIPMAIMDSGGDGWFVVALFRVGTANALNACASYLSAGRGGPMSMRYVDLPGTTSTTTYNVRCGVGASGRTVGVLGTGSTRFFGAENRVTITLQEIKV
ncbi:hypothetical protein CCP2SC5_290014 [Azospirillaceae bacterium]